MRSIRPYVSIDIETTGLNTELAEVLEVALVYDDGITDVEELPRLNLLIKPVGQYYEAGAMAMHGQLFSEINCNLNQLCNPEIIGYKISAWIETLNITNKIVFAGKNASTFDLPILSRITKMPEYHHRVIDVGSVYYNYFGYVPSLVEINKLLCLKPVSHRALDDALNVVQALRSCGEPKL